MTDDLKNRIEALVRQWESWREGILAEKFASHKPEPVEVLHGKVWTKITIEGYGVQAFIAPRDGANKAIGAYKAGDIFYPASWNAPAKNKRGSVYDKNPMKCFDLYGVKRMDQL